ncbi:hypothetical protein [Streptomyces sp. NBC_01431]|uniref:hypothetical protein n=1 Tax=Streptomyces sp. NBC_01431 TaxID=2903863 RepID=UPI002E2FA44A|nr:hypothetical protein [Streptomyces sp. NBC_01431]
MRPERFRQFCLDTLPQHGPDITAAEVWEGDGAPPFGIVITFANGSRLWATITGVLAPGTKVDDADMPVTGTAPEPVALPALCIDGQTSPALAEAYLAAVLAQSGNNEVSNIYGYQQRLNQAAAYPGVGIGFHNGARIYMPITHTSRPGQNMGREPYRLQKDF